MLDVLGLRPAEAECYEALVGHGASSPAELAGILDLHVEVVRGCLQHLVHLGSATGPGPDTGQFAASPPMVVVVPFGDNARERLAALERGVRIEVVAETDALGDLELLEVARVNRELGYGLRIVPQLPTRMMIVDEDLALLPLSPRPHVEAPGAVLIQASGLLTVLVALFQLTWRGAAPATAEADLSASVRDTDLEPLDYDLLRLLDLGVTDR